MLNLPGMLDPAEVEKRELEGGIVIVGRASLKEYIEGLKRGWFGRVDPWEWEKEVDEKLKYDGVFENPPVVSENEPVELEPTPSRPNQLPGTFSFLSRPQPPQAVPSLPDSTPTIPEEYHAPPNPLPPQPPIVLVPFIKRLGFKQVPWMIYDFFTERYRVESGSKAALALIENHIRPYDKAKDGEFDRNAEEWYKKDTLKVHEKISEARKTYYDELVNKIQEVRDLRDGKRELSEDEKKSTKPLTTEADLIAQRRKKELRWMGQEEGWDIVRPEVEVGWDDRFDGVLRVYELPDEKV